MIRRKINSRRLPWNDIINNIWTDKMCKYRGIFKKTHCTEISIESSIYDEIKPIIVGIYRDMDVCPNIIKHDILSLNEPAYEIQSS